MACAIVRYWINTWLFSLLNVNCRFEEKKQRSLLVMIREPITMLWPYVYDVSNFVQNVHQGYRTETLVRFLKARDGSVSKANKMVSAYSFHSHLKFNIVSGWILHRGNILTVISTLQLVDCLNWRIDNEIDQILAVSFLLS